MEPSDRAPLTGPTAAAGDQASAAASTQPPTRLPSPPAESRQRWRLVYRRRPEAPPLAQREQVAAWEESFATSGLPLVGLDQPVPRPRLVFAAPLGVGVAADAELVDMFLFERRPVAEVRTRLAASLPAGHELVDAYDVWLGEAPLSGQVVAADYRVDVSTTNRSSLDARALDTACRRLLEATTLPRAREKGGRSVSYDLRPLLEGIEVAAAGTAETMPPDRLGLRIRTRFDPERGVGRPDEVLAALSEEAGVPLSAGSIVRERLVLASDRASLPVK
jgi:radical SAM-linked protein